MQDDTKNCKHPAGDKLKRLRTTFLLFAFVLPAYRSGYGSLSAGGAGLRYSGAGLRTAGNLRASSLRIGTTM
jgi:hypothetical protein